MQSNYYISSTKKYGKSIFANKSFKRNEAVFVISGPIVTKPSIYTVPIEKDLFINPLPPGKFLNHSCKPTCGIKNRTQVVAMKNLKKGNEITIDYAMIVREYNQRKLKQDISCKCGSLLCRGEFGSYKKLPASLKRKYRGFISDFLVYN